MREKRLKPIQIDRETYRIMERIWGKGKVPYNPTIKDTEVKEDGRQVSSSKE